jgi:hypothetical protein
MKMIFGGVVEMMKQKGNHGYSDGEKGIRASTSKKMIFHGSQGQRNPILKKQEEKIRKRIVGTLK